jgi:hypothetical protein
MRIGNTFKNWQLLHTAPTAIATLARVQNKFRNISLWNVAAATLTHLLLDLKSVYGMKTLHYKCWHSTICCTGGTLTLTMRYKNQQTYCKQN